MAPFPAARADVFRDLWCISLFIRLVESERNDAVLLGGHQTLDKTVWDNMLHHFRILPTRLRVNQRKKAGLAK